MISESFSVTTEITLNCRLSELKKQLYNHRDDLLVYIHDGSNSSRHQKTTNYGFLSDEAVKGSASRSIYIVLARKLTPEIRENCIPIIPAEICSTTDAASANWNDLISLTENNPDEFNLRTQRAYEEACSNFKGSDYCQDAAVLSVVSESSVGLSLVQTQLTSVKENSKTHINRLWRSMFSIGTLWQMLLR